MDRDELLKYIYSIRVGVLDDLRKLLAEGNGVFSPELKRAASDIETIERFNELCHRYPAPREGSEVNMHAKAPDWVENGNWFCKAFKPGYKQTIKGKKILPW